jgi:L-fuconolactonase
VLDAHHHLWDRRRLDFDYAWLDRPGMEAIADSFLPEDLRPLLDRAGLRGSVVVQTQHRLAENDWALSLADAHPWIEGVVGWVDLATADVADQVARFAEHSKAVGVRHVTQDEPDDDFIVRPDIVRGLKALERAGMPFDLLFYAKHLRHAPTLARLLPELPMVLDHLGKPAIARGGFDAWIGDFRAAAACPNLHAKLSGLVTEADQAAWKPSDLTPYLDAALDLFGPQRLMFGSDWPVCLLAGSYERVHAVIADRLSALSPSEQTAIMGQTGRRFYGITPG